MKLLDLAKFEKIAHDDKTATMRHKDGHTMTILISALPKIHQEQLKRLKMKDGGDPGKMADDTDDDSDDSEESEEIPAENPVSTLGAPIPFPAADALARQTANNPPAAMPRNLTNVQNVLALPAQSAQLGAQGADMNQKIAQAAAQGNAEIAERKQAIQQNAANQLAQNAADVKTHVDAFRQWNADHPYDANQYLDKMSTPGRMTNAISLFLGGFAGQGKGNVILDYLNNQIKNNIETQVQEHGTQRNIYGAYQDLFKNQNAAVEATRASLLGELAAASDRQAAILGTPQAAAANALFKSDMLGKQAEAIRNSAVYRMGFGGNAPAGAPGPGMPAGIAAPMVQPGRSDVGPPSAGPAYGPDTANPQGVYQPKPILAPNAGQLVKQLALRADAKDPTAQAQLPLVQEQYARAQRADEVLARSKDLYNALAESKDSVGGWMSRQIGGVDAGGDGLIGTAANLAGKYAGDLTSQYMDLGGNRREAEMNRNYNTAAQELSDMLRSVYPAIGGGELHSKLSGILPDKNDDKSQVMAKMKAFEDLIRTSGSFSFLKDNGMLQR